jgi:hypothetical protein
MEKAVKTLFTQVSQNAKSQRAEVEKPVDLAQQVIDRNPILKAKLIKQLRPILALLPHHRCRPKSRPSQTETRTPPTFKPTFSTKSARLSRCRTSQPTSAYRTGSRRSALETGTTLRAPNWPPRQAEENLRDVGTPAFPICWLAGAHAS